MIKRKRWSKKEIEVLLMYGKRLTLEEVQQYLPHRTLDALRVKISKLHTEGKKFNTSTLNCTLEKNTIEDKNSQLMFSKIAKQPNNHIQIILQRLESIESLLKKIAIADTQVQVTKPWSKNEERYLVNWYPTRPISEICKILCKTPSDVSAKVSELGLQKPVDNAKVNSELIDRILDMYKTTTIREMAMILKVSEATITNTIKFLKDKGIVAERKKLGKGVTIKKALKFEGLKFMDVCENHNYKPGSLRTLLSNVGLSVVNGIIVDKSTRTPLHLIVKNGMTPSDIPSIATQFNYSIAEVKRYYNEITGN